MIWFFQNLIQVDLNFQQKEVVIATKRIKVQTLFSFVTSMLRHENFIVAAKSLICIRVMLQKFIYLRENVEPAIWQFALRNLTVPEIKAECLELLKWVYPLLTANDVYRYLAPEVHGEEAVKCAEVQRTRINYSYCAWSPNRILNVSPTTWWSRCWRHCAIPTMITRPLHCCKLFTTLCWTMTWAESRACCST